MSVAINCPTLFVTADNVSIKPDKIGVTILIIGAKAEAREFLRYANEDIKAEIIKAFISYKGSTLAMGKATKFGVRLTLNGVWTIQSAAKKMVEKINHVISLLKEKSIYGVTNCPMSGKIIQNKTTLLVNDAFVTLDEEDANKIKEEYQMKENEFENAPNNYLKGLLGALVGAIVCGIAYYILYTLGYISIWIGVLAIFLSSFLYDKFGIHDHRP